jgi:protein CpxP
MRYMNSTRFYQIIIGLLVISNILLISKDFIQGKEHFHPDKPRNIIIERLHFDGGQIQQYDIAIQQHRKNVREKSDKILRLKKELYHQLSGTQDSNRIDSLANQIACTQKELEKIHYVHFREIKSICKPDQMNDYYLLVEKLTDLFPFGHKPPPRR